MSVLGRLDEFAQRVARACTDRNTAKAIAEYQECAMRFGSQSPAALGCIEHGLLAELWPGCFLFHGHLGWGWGKGATSYIESQPSKAEALVVALESSP